MMADSACFSRRALSGVGGLLVSAHWDVAAGASVALCAVVLFAATLLVSPRAAGG